MLEDHLRLINLVDERDAEAFVQIARGLEPLADGVRVEAGLRKDLRVGMKGDLRPRTAPCAFFSELGNGLTRLELHLVDASVPLHGRDEMRRERVHDRGADAVEPSRRLVVLAFEFTTRMQRREDDLERRLFRARVFVDGDAASVIRDGDRGAVSVERELNRARIAVHRFVDAIVEHLPNEMVKAVR